jgi:hypothetical protein
MAFEFAFSGHIHESMRSERQFDGLRVLCLGSSYVVLISSDQANTGQCCLISVAGLFTLLNEQNISLLPSATRSKSSSRFEAEDSDGPLSINPFAVSDDVRCERPVT